MANGHEHQPHVNLELVKLLESALADAKRGALTGGGVLCLLGGGSFMSFTADGGDSASMLAAATTMQHDIIAKMRTPKQSRVVLPGLGQRM